MKNGIILILFLAFTFTNCQSNETIKNVQEIKDSIKLKETFNEEDIVVNEYLIEQLKPIRDNFKRINSIENWTRIEEIDLWETTERGEAKFYYSGKKLEKIVTRHYGEMGQRLTEYYLLNNQLSFVLERECHYNRPFYQDSISMAEVVDTEFFDFEKSEIIENRNYFENRELIHQFHSEDCGAPFSRDYLEEEEKRIILDFEKLMNM